MPDVRDASPLTRAVLLAAGLLVAGLVFHELVTLAVAILMTVLLAIPMGAAADLLERGRVPVPRWLGALLALLLGVAVLVGLLSIVIPTFVDQAEQFVDEVPGTIDSIQERLNDIGGEGTGAEVQDFLERYTEDPQELIGPLAAIGLNVAGVLAAIVLILITAYYMAVSPRPLLDGALALFPPGRRAWAAAVMRRLRDAWVGWMQGVLVDMLITGVLLYVGLELIGLDFTVFFAVFSALLVLIPYFGAIIGAVPPTVFALAEGPETALLTLGVYVLVQQVESNLTIPLVMANRVSLHPALVAIGVVIVGQLFGFIGLFVAVPILSLIVVLVDELWVKPLEAAVELPEFVRGSDLLEGAYRFAAAAHHGPARRGDTDISHPAHVAALLAERGFSEPVVAAALLHDVIEDTSVDRGRIEERFGPAVAHLVDEMTEDEAIPAYPERKAEHRRRVGREARVAAIYAADKLATTRDLNESKSVPEAERLTHYRRTLAELRAAQPGLPFLSELEDELERLLRRSRTTPDGDGAGGETSP